MPTAPEKNRAKRELERGALHLGMPRHLGSPRIARMDPLERYARQGAIALESACSEFLEIIARSACRTRRAQEGVDRTRARCVDPIGGRDIIRMQLIFTSSDNNEPKVSRECK